MRISSLLIAAAIAAAACRGDSTSPSTNPDGSNPSATTLSISIDSVSTELSGVVGTAVPARIHVTLAGQPAPNVVVTWIIIAGGGKVSSASTTTNASGATDTEWTLGDTARVNLLQATVTGGSATLQAQALAGPATSIVPSSADSSAVVAGSSLLLTARVVDKAGNGVSNVPVTWSSPLGSLATLSSTTGPSGRAEVAFTTTPAPGIFTVTATAAGLGATTFKVVGM